MVPVGRVEYQQWGDGGGWRRGKMEGVGGRRIGRGKQRREGARDKQQIKKNSPQVLKIIVYRTNKTPEQFKDRSGGRGGERGCYNNSRNSSTIGAGRWVKEVR